MPQKHGIALKPSKYNLLFEDKEHNEYYIFNTWSLGFAVIDCELFSLLEKAKNDSRYIADLQAKKPQEFQELLRGRVIVDSLLREEDQVWLRYNETKFSRSSLNATIVPTNACNLACEYCYQTRNANHMNKDTEERVVNFIISNCHGVKALNITWYGGEPLLAIDIIQRISSELIAHCKKIGIKYNACMVTNGTLLTPENFRIIKRLKIEHLQITVDGPPEIHDVRRPYRNSVGSSFEAIFSNIDRLLGKVDINLRMNIDKANICQSNNLIDYLQNCGYLNDGNRFSASLGYVRPWTTGNCKLQANCLSPAIFSSAWVEFQARNYAKGKALALLPERANICSAVNKNTFIIDPLGNLKRCWIDICSKSEETGKIGDIEQSFDYYNPLTVRWLSYDPLVNNRNSCGNCAYFPICAGGCPYLQLFRRKMRKDGCQMWKIQIEETIKRYANERHLTT